MSVSKDIIKQCLIGKQRGIPKSLETKAYKTKKVKTIYE